MYAAMIRERLAQKPFRLPEQFNLLRWFSLVSLFLITFVAIGLGLIATRFVVHESIKRDSMLSAQFLQAIAEAEIRHARLEGQTTIGELFDRHEHPELTGPEYQRIREEFLDHIAALPDALLASLYTRDRVIVWSTNPALIGTKISNEDLDQAFDSLKVVTESHIEFANSRPEQQFLREPERLLIETYVPLRDRDNNVASVIEIYKEPVDLIARVQRGHTEVWLATAIGGGLLYLGLFWIVRRAARLLEAQHQQLIANETFVALGEMSSAVAHSLRNPLAAIRSSAELALDGGPTRKNITDIIDQVDRMSQWVRELLLSSRPLGCGPEAVDLVPAIKEAIQAHRLQLERLRIRVEFDERKAAPLVVSQQALLRQVLNSIISNAIEAMSEDGLLQIGIEQPPAARKQLLLTISDSGKGMSRQQELHAFTQFYTTKQKGLGVGLLLVRRIMERFGGKVSLRSQEQQGTCVSLNFKIAQEEE